MTEQTIEARLCGHFEETDSYDEKMARWGNLWIQCGAAQRGSAEEARDNFVPRFFCIEKVKGVSR